MVEWEEGDQKRIGNLCEILVLLDCCHRCRTLMRFFQFFFPLCVWDRKPVRMDCPLSGLGYGKQQTCAREREEWRSSIRVCLFLCEINHLITWARSQRSVSFVAFLEWLEFYPALFRDARAWWFKVICLHKRQRSSLSRKDVAEVERTYANVCRVSCRNL